MNQQITGTLINHENKTFFLSCLHTETHCGDQQSKEEGTHKENGALARVQNPQSLVFAGGEDLGAVPVPAGAVDEVGVHAVEPHHRLPAHHVPQDHHVVAGWKWSEKNR